MTKKPQLCVAVERKGKETSLQDRGMGAQLALPYSWVILLPAELASECINREYSVQIHALRGHPPVLKELKMTSSCLVY